MVAVDKKSKKNVKQFALTQYLQAKVSSWGTFLGGLSSYMQGKSKEQRGEKTCAKQLFARYVPSLHIFEQKYPHVDFFGGRTSCWHGKSKEERDEKRCAPHFFE